MNKLEKLKQNEEFEAFGAAFTLISVTFFLFFTAHLLGCFYTILLTYEDGENWLSSYNPELVNADASTRYTVSLYWAIVTIRSAGEAAEGRFPKFSGWHQNAWVGMTEADNTRKRKENNNTTSKQRKTEGKKRTKGQPPSLHRGEAARRLKREKAGQTGPRVKLKRIPPPLT
jgi:hypothetical protein